MEVQMTLKGRLGLNEGCCPLLLRTATATANYCLQRLQMARFGLGLHTNKQCLAMFVGNAFSRGCSRHLV